MFGQPFVLRQLGDSSAFSNGAALDVLITLLLLIGVGALCYGVALLARAPSTAPRVHLKPEHRRRRKQTARR